MRRTAHKYAKSYWSNNVLPKKKVAKTNWKKEQKSHTSSKSVRLGLLVLVSLVSLIVVSKLFDFIGSLSRPLSPDNFSAAPVSWEGKTILHLALKDEDTYLLSLNPLDNSLILTKIPSETQMNVPFDFGTWPARSVYSLGQTEKVPMGAQLLSQTLSQTFGVFVGGYMIFPEGKIRGKMEENLEKIRRNPLDFFGLMRSSKTNLSPRQLWSLWTQIHAVRPDKIKFQDLADSSITSQSKNNDGSEVLKIDPLKLNLLVQKNFSDERLKDEGLSIGIFNATSHSGLAEKASRIIINLGGRVIFTTNLEEHSDFSFTQGKSSYAQQLIAEIFTLNCPLPQSGWSSLVSKKSDVKKCASQDSYVTSSFAELNLILGEDFFLRYNKVR